MKIIKTREEIEEMDEQIMGEQENPLYQEPQVDENGNPVPGGNAPPGNAPMGPQGGVSSVAPGEQNN